MERLSFDARDFRSVLLVGCPDPAWAGALGSAVSVVEPGARGGGVTAFISARSLGHLGEQEQRSLDDLAERSEVEELHNVAGDDCYLLKVRTPDIAGLNRIVRWLNGPPLGFTTNTTIVLGTYFEKVGGVVVRPEDGNDEA